METWVKNSVVASLRGLKAFEHPDVDAAVLIHQRGSGVTKLLGVLTGQPGVFRHLPHALDAAAGQAFPLFETNSASSLRRISFVLCRYAVIASLSSVEVHNALLFP